MRGLFDQGTPVPLRRSLVGHHVETSWQRGWAQLSNGGLLAAAEQAGSDVLVTTDRTLRYQQNLAGRRIAVFLLAIGHWPLLAPHGAAVAAANDAVQPGEYREWTP